MRQPCSTLPERKVSRVELSYHTAESPVSPWWHGDGKSRLNLAEDESRVRFI